MFSFKENALVCDCLKKSVTSWISFNFLLICPLMLIWNINNVVMQINIFLSMLMISNSRPYFQFNQMVGVHILSIDIGVQVPIIFSFPFYAAGAVGIFLFNVQNGGFWRPFGTFPVFSLPFIRNYFFHFLVLIFEDKCNNFWQPLLGFPSTLSPCKRHNWEISSSLKNILKWLNALKI